MRVYEDPAELKIDRPVVTLGLFDGVHRGHQILLHRLLEKARLYQHEELVISLWPHPRIVLGKHDGSFTLLSTLEEKLWLLEKMGIHHCWIIPFDHQMASLSAGDFITKYLTGYFVPGAMVIGDDHHFGKDGSGNIITLQSAGKKMGFDVDHLTTHREGDTRISSSFIRACLAAGDLASANQLLGYPYLLMGLVENGKKLGRSLGFPTANIRCCPEWKQIPADGVYAVRVDWKEKCYSGMLNIGLRPTIEDHEHRTVEVHLFDLEEDLYGDTLRIHFISRIRDEMRFNGLDELKEQLGRDREMAMVMLNKWQQSEKSYLCKE